MLTRVSESTPSRKPPRGGALKFSVVQFSAEELEGGFLREQNAANYVAVRPSKKRSQSPPLKVKNIEQDKIPRVGGGQPPNPSFVIRRGEIGVQNAFSSEAKFFHPRPGLLPCAISRVAIESLPLPPTRRGIGEGPRSLKADARSVWNP